MPGAPVDAHPAAWGLVNGRPPRFGSVDFEPDFDLYSKETWDRNFGIELSKAGKIDFPARLGVPTRDHDSRSCKQNAHTKNAQRDSRRAMYLVCGSDAQVAMKMSLGSGRGADNEQVETLEAILKRPFFRTIFLRK